MKKIIAMLLISLMLVPSAAMAHSHHRHHRPPRHERYRDRPHTDVRVRNAVIVGGLIAAILTAQAKDREHDGINDKSDVTKK